MCCCCCSEDSRRRCKSYGRSDAFMCGMCLFFFGWVIVMVGLPLFLIRENNAMYTAGLVVLILGASLFGGGFFCCSCAGSDCCSPCQDCAGSAWGCICHHIWCSCFTESDGSRDTRVHDSTRCSCCYQSRQSGSGWEHGGSNRVSLGSANTIPRNLAARRLHQVDSSIRSLTSPVIQTQPTVLTTSPLPVTDSERRSSSRDYISSSFAQEPPSYSEVVTQNMHVTLRTSRGPPPSSIHNTADASSGQVTVSHVHRTLSAHDRRLRTHGASPRSCATPFDQPPPGYDEAVGSLDINHYEQHM